MNNFALSMLTALLVAGVGVANATDSSATTDQATKPPGSDPAKGAKPVAMDDLPKSATYPPPRTIPADSNARYAADPSTQGAVLTISPGAVSTGIDPYAPSTGGLTISIAGYPTSIAYCLDSNQYYRMRVDYNINAFQQEVLWRIGLYEVTTGAVAYDEWHQVFVERAIYLTRFVSPPYSGGWAPFVEAYGAVNGQWQLAYREYIPVNYSYTHCMV